MAERSNTANTTMAGEVKRLMPDRGFGFIRGDNGREEYFFHRSSCFDWDALQVGARVQFVPSASDRGPRAEMVRLQA